MLSWLRFMNAAKTYITRSNLRGIRAITLDCLSIAFLISIGLYLDDWRVWLILAWPIGLFQFALGECLTHEASHYNLFRSRWMNVAGEWLYCIPFFFTLSDYRREHAVHHHKLGDAEDHIVRDNQQRGLYETPPKLVWIWFCMPILGLAGLWFLRSCSHLASSLKSVGKIFIFWSLILLVGVHWGFTTEIVFGWLLPLFWCCASFLWWSEIRDHYNTRTGTRSDLGILNVLTHNNGYHDVHHRFPSIPWYRLPEAHHALCKEQNLDISYGFLDAFRQMTSNYHAEKQREKLPAKSGMTPEAP